MPLVLNEEQRQLKTTGEDFFNKTSPISALRQLRDECDPNGYSLELWQQMAEMGWLGIIIPEQYGGLDFGFVGLGQVLEAGGRTLAASPLISTVVLSASALLLGGSEKQKSELLPSIASGELIVALASQEGPLHRPDTIATRAEKTDGGYLLQGRKVFVIDGHVADRLIVVARTEDSGGSDSDKGSAGISLFLIHAQQAGVEIHRSHMVDSRNAAEIRCHNVEVTEDDLIGPLNEGYPLLQQLLDRGNICLAAEMLGSAQQAFECTLAYIKERKQFGAAIGSFQALQHRAAKMFCEIELAKSVVLKALQAIDEPASQPSPEQSLLASLAKVHLCETLRLVSSEAIQMYGGMGMTDEEDIGFFIKRARVAQQTFGDDHYHSQRYASLRGY